MNKKDTKTLEQIKKNLNISTKAENLIIEHLFLRNLNRSILIYNYGTISELNGWININTCTNVGSYDFEVLASRINKGDLSELWHKIE